jgi:hypothetical protein
MLCNEEVNVALATNHVAFDVDCIDFYERFYTESLSLR